MPWTWMLSSAAGLQPKAAAISHAPLQLLGWTIMGIPKEFRNKNFFTLQQGTLSAGFLSSPFSFYHITYTFFSSQNILRKVVSVQGKVKQDTNHSFYTGKFPWICTLLYLLSSKPKRYPFQEQAAVVLYLLSLLQLL